MKIKYYLPEWLDPSKFLEYSENESPDIALKALNTAMPEECEFATLISPGAGAHLESVASRAVKLTRQHFGNTISLYAPLYLSNHCSGGCEYCGFASDREYPRRRMEKAELLSELDALKQKGIEDILLLTGERTDEADFDYLLESVRISAEQVHNVTIESFAMTMEEYSKLVRAGCTGVTLYQETYSPKNYNKLHRWGEKSDYEYRLNSPERALAAGMRTVGTGVLLGLSDPLFDVICLFRHIRHLQKKFWKAGIHVSFPRICKQVGGYEPEHSISDHFLAQLIFAFRICLPDTHLVLSTREQKEFRDGMAGVGISRMSVASRTSVGGYKDESHDSEKQFQVNDNRNVSDFCNMLMSKDLQPVYKNWDAVFQK